MTVSGSGRSGRLEVGAFGERQRGEAHLLHRVERDADDVGDGLLHHQVDGGPRRAQAAGPSGQHEAPHRRKDVAECRGRLRSGHTIEPPAGGAADHQSGHSAMCSDR